MEKELVEAAKLATSHPRWMLSDGPCWCECKRQDAANKGVKKHSLFCRHLKELKTSIESYRSSGWLIEGAGVYWTGRNLTDFTYDHLEAIRFSRQEDAERILCWVLPKEYRQTCRTTEHIWGLFGGSL